MPVSQEPGVEASSCHPIPTPHPYTPLNIIADGEAARSSKPQPQWAQQRARRAQILAATRRLIGNRDQEKLTVRNIASAAHVSVPTVYNLIGDRNQVLAAAVNDHTIALGSAASLTPDHPHFLSALAELYANSAEQEPDFMRSITLTYFSGKSELFHHWHNCGVKLITDAVRHTECLGLTRSNIDIPSVVKRSSAIIASTVHEWALGCCTLDELRQELATASGFILMSALKPSMGDSIEKWLSTVRETQPRWSVDARKDAPFGHAQTPAAILWTNALQ